jgi:hypothetical protein
MIQLIDRSEVISDGVAVEIRNRFENRWVHGFSIECSRPGEYQVRRHSDGHVLPAWFPADMLRPLSGR